MKAYKGFKRHDDGTLWCRDFKYEPGKTYKHEEDIRLCVTGFHACNELYQVWHFYPNNGYNAFYEVECGGKIIRSKGNDGKFVCSEIRLVKEVDMSDVEKFDYLYYFSEGFLKVKRDEKYNFIDTSGKLLSEQWYDGIWKFYEGVSIVRITDRYNYEKYNFIDTSGKLLSEQWYDYACNFLEGLAKVRLCEKYNYVNTKGKLLSEQWYDYAYVFSEGFSKVELKNKYNYINTEGKLLSDQWYDDALNFSDGFARVQINFKWYKIDRDGKIIQK